VIHEERSGAIDTVFLFDLSILCRYKDAKKFPCPLLPKEPFRSYPSLGFYWDCYIGTFLTKFVISGIARFVASATEKRLVEM
jgi:hypothetical protein